MMDDSTMVSTAQAAKALGVGVSSVKRWVDDGVLPAYKTAGGHRKLCLADVLRLANERQFPRLNLKHLPLVVPSIANDADRAASLYRQLLDGDTAAAEGLIRAAYLGGMTIGAVADDIIRPAMKQIGIEWEAGRIDILHERRASHICEQAIHGLRRMLDERVQSATAPLALGGSPHAHWHGLANLMAEVVLNEAGWRVINFGANTPLASFRKAIKEFRPRLMWLSVNPLDDAEGFLEEYQLLYKDAQEANVAIAVGGLGLTQDLRSRMPYTTFGDGLVHLAAFARSLHPVAKPRRRGRPPGKRDDPKSSDG
jgi:excisionase family DNA binding protein